MPPFPMVSILISYYNQEQYLEECLQSILNQNYNNWEAIIVDDGSQNDSSMVAENLCQLDPRFKYFWKPNGGVSSARNYGLALSKGTYILPLDADDKISRLYVREAVECFLADQEVRLVYSEAEFFGAKQGIWPLPKYSYDHLLLDNMIFCSALFKKAELLLVGEYDEDLTYGSEDWDFWIRFLNEDSKVLRLPTVHFFYRIKDSSRTVDVLNDKKKLLQTFNHILRKNIKIYHSRFPTIIRLLRFVGYLDFRVFKRLAVLTK